MLKCEGYMMFRGKAKVAFKNGDKVLRGTWLYRPDNERWYITPCDEFPWGTSFAQDQIDDIVEQY